MSDLKGSFEDHKARAMEHMAELSRLLGMVPSDDTIDVQDPMTHDSIPLSDWLNKTREAFLSLSTSISKALDIQLQ